MSVSRGGPALSHICFVDDLVLFGEASKSQVLCILDCMGEFSHASGEVIAKEKSKIYFSHNVTHVEKDNLSRLARVGYTEDLGKCLGVPVIHKRVNHHTYTKIVSKIKDKTNGSASHSLNLARRMTLTKSVMMAIPSYTMQSTKIPHTTCDAINRMIHRFIWTRDSNGKYLSKVSWNKIVNPKDEGAIGIKSMRKLNEASIYKNASCYFGESPVAWVCMMQSKYGRRTGSAC